MFGKFWGLSHVAFVRHHPDFTSNVSLREYHTILHKFTLRTEVHSIIQLARPSSRNELVAKLSNLSIHDKTLQIKMR